jgi:hypothetical protein
LEEIIQDLEGIIQNLKGEGVSKALMPYPKLGPKNWLRYPGFGILKF